jgi:formylglycine-generating enzyme required for sulfatase activity
MEKPFLLKLSIFLIITAFIFKCGDNTGPTQVSAVGPPDMADIESGQTSSDNGGISLKYDIEIGKAEVTNQDFREFLQRVVESYNGIYKGQKIIDINSDNCQIEYNGDLYWVKDWEDPEGNKIDVRDYPVIEVTWYGAVAYCNWLSEQIGYEPAYDLSNWKLKDSPDRVEGYRLPTSNEWEYVARGGRNGDSTIYAGSNDLDQVGWYLKNSGAPGNSNLLTRDPGQGTMPVGQKNTNELGIWDMSGNVREWTNTRKMGDRIQRGGSWLDDQEQCNIIWEIGEVPSALNMNLGFRLARTKNPGNDAPKATFSVTPDSGNISTEFTFDASGCTDTEDSTADLLVRWDWDNSGFWDTDFSTKKTATHRYPVTNKWTVAMEVKDTEGAISKTTREVYVGNTAPVASFTVSPQSGDTETEFNFDASGCSDAEDEPADLQVRWDWENDGNWDTEYSPTKSTTHKYTMGGNYTVKLEVKDTNDSTDTAIQVIMVDEAVNPVNPGEMVFVSAGQTGSDNGDINLAYDIEVGKYEVTNGEFVEFLNSYDKAFPDGSYNGEREVLIDMDDEKCQIGHNGNFYIKDWTDSDGKPIDVTDFPVVEVTWYGAVTYCNWLSEEEGLNPAYQFINWRQVKDSPDSLEGYRLPEESEWEYIARGGNNGEATVYAGSDVIDDVAWYWDNAGYRSHMVGQKQPNELGVFDMSGNVWEWTYTILSMGQRPTRGGSFDNFASRCEPDQYHNAHVSLSDETVGFRIVKTENPKE